MSPFFQCTLYISVEKGLGFARATPHRTQSVSWTDQLCSLKPYRSAVGQWQIDIAQDLCSVFQTIPGRSWPRCGFEGKLRITNFRWYVNIWINAPLSRWLPGYSMTAFFGTKDTFNSLLPWKSPRKCLWWQIVKCWAVAFPWRYNYKAVGGKETTL